MTYHHENRTFTRQESRHEWTRNKVAEMGHLLVLSVRLSVPACILLIEINGNFSSSTPKRGGSGLWVSAHPVVCPPPLSIYHSPNPILSKSPTKRKSYFAPNHFTTTRSHTWTRLFVMPEYEEVAEHVVARALEDQKSEARPVVLNLGAISPHSKQDSRQIHLKKKHWKPSTTRSRSYGDLYLGVSSRNVMWPLYSIGPLVCFLSPFWSPWSLCSVYTREYWSVSFPLFGFHGLHVVFIWGKSVSYAVIQSSQEMFVLEGGILLNRSRTLS